VLERLPTQTEENVVIFLLIPQFVASSKPHDQTTNILAIKNIPYNYNAIYRVRARNITLSDISSNHCITILFFKDFQSSTSFL